LGGVLDLEVRRKGAENWILSSLHARFCLFGLHRLILEHVNFFHVQGAVVIGSGYANMMSGVLFDGVLVLDLVDFLVLVAYDDQLLAGVSTLLGAISINLGAAFCVADPAVDLFLLRFRGRIFGLGERQGSHQRHCKYSKCNFLH